MSERCKFEYGTPYGRVTDIYMLPVGTVFSVSNGCWDGEIVKYNGEKGMYIPETSKVYTLKEEHDYGLVLSDVKRPEKRRRRRENLLGKKMQQVKIDKIIADNEDGEYEINKVNFYHEHTQWLIEQIKKIDNQGVARRLMRVELHAGAADDTTQQINFYYDHSEWLVEHAEIVERGRY